MHVPPLLAAIFDMDGLLVDSEPLWRRTEVEVFGEVGLSITEAMCEATTGLRIDEVVEHWFRRAPWNGPTCAELAERIVDRMVERVAREGRALPGAHRAVEACAAAGLRLAIASSSHERLIAATLERLELTASFGVIVSAQHERYGKPHPAVFLAAAERLDVPPPRCLVLEDSIAGVIAAKAARMTCVAVPAPSDRDDRRLGVADRVLGSLEEVEPALLDALVRGEPAREVRHALTILAVDDLPAMARFYRAAFGWPTRVDVPVYVELGLPEARRLGLYEREAFGRNTGRVPARVPAGELAPTELYVVAPSFDEVLERLRSLDARELSPPSMRAWGDEVAYFADPEGNVLAVARP